MDATGICAGGLLSFLSKGSIVSQFAQYYIPELDKGNKTHGPLFELEYVTYTIDALHPSGEGGQHPVPIRHLPEELQKGVVGKSKYAPYGLKDLTIGSWMGLGQALGDGKREDLRKRFRKYMFMK